MQIQCLIRHVYDSTTNKFIAFRIQQTVKIHMFINKFSMFKCNVYDSTMNEVCLHVLNLNKTVQK